jgi:hypothetical protein
MKQGRYTLKHQVVKHIDVRADKICAELQKQRLYHENRTENTVARYTQKKRIKRNRRYTGF